MAIVWRDQMSVDRGIVDNDHKCLISLVNDVQVIRHGPNLPKQVAEILERVDIYARTHFDREEQLQSAVGFPGAEAHHQHHVDLTDALVAMRADWNIIRVPKAMMTFHRRLCDFLYHWLIDHILKEDLMMRPFVAEMRQHAKGFQTLDQAVVSGQGSIDDGLC